ncbi:MAG: hypothetical protein ACM3O3_11735 [Syntrophothermus sp.]
MNLKNILVPAFFPTNATDALENGYYQTKQNTFRIINSKKFKSRFQRTQ